MKRSTNGQTGQNANGASSAITQYMAVLQEVYPAAKAASRVVVRPDRCGIVSAPLPTRSHDRMRLFDQMADIGTRLLLETGKYIILSGR